jgi:DNA primase
VDLKVASTPQTIVPDNVSEPSYGFRKCCAAVREAVRIEKIASCYTQLERLGASSPSWFTGRCPLPDHEDNTPSFYIYPPGRFWCYGCARGGDVVDLEFHCGDYGELWEAMISLAVEFSVELPERPASWFARQKRQQPMRDALQEAKVRHAQRRLYRIFAPTIERIEDEAERQTERAQTWHDLRHVAYLVVAGRRSA